MPGCDGARRGERSHPAPKARGGGQEKPPRDKFQKNIYFCFIDYAKVFVCVDHNKMWKILKEMGIPDHLDVPVKKSVSRSGSNS